MNRLKASGVGRIVAGRLRDFQKLRRRGDEDWFAELCFCILTANSSAKLGIEIQHKIGRKGFLQLGRRNLASTLRRLGHRYWRRRASFIFEARRFRNIKNIVTKFRDEFEARQWLVKNVKGIGYKEASHFLRNVGYTNVAIIDRHVIKVMHENGLIGAIPKNLTKNTYMKCERILRSLSEKTGLTLAELDLYLWYLKTNQVLK